MCGIVYIITTYMYMYMYSDCVIVQDYMTTTCTCSISLSMIGKIPPFTATGDGPSCEYGLPL